MDINFNYVDKNHVSISLNETVGLEEINAIVDCFEQAFNIQDITITEFTNYGSNWRKYKKKYIFFR